MTATSENDITVTIEEQITGSDIDMFYELYEHAFGHLRTKAAARQVLHEDEFREEMLDPRVMKFVSWSADGHPLGLTTLTKDLATVPWISPEYFYAKYPVHAARDTIYYLGFTLVRKEARRTTAFRDVYAILLARMVSESAILCVDICSYNSSRGIAAALRRMAGTDKQLSIDEIDTQTYFAADFAG